MSQIEILKKRALIPPDLWTNTPNRFNNPIILMAKHLSEKEGFGSIVFNEALEHDGKTVIKDYIAIRAPERVQGILRQIADTPEFRALTAVGEETSKAINDCDWNDEFKERVKNKELEPEEIGIVVREVVERELVQYLVTQR